MFPMGVNDFLVIRTKACPRHCYLNFRSATDQKIVIASSTETKLKNKNNQLVRGDGRSVSARST